MKKDILARFMREKKALFSLFYSIYIVSNV